MSFALDLSQFVRKAKMNADLVVRKVTLDVARGVVMRTPVDTGRARANWQFGEGQVPTGEVGAADPNGTATIAQLATQIDRTKAGGVSYIANNLPYILPLEYGHSQQAPSGMVRTTLTEYQQYIRNAVAQLSR